MLANVIVKSDSCEPKCKVADLEHYFALPAFLPCAIFLENKKRGVPWASPRSATDLKKYLAAKSHFTHRKKEKLSGTQMYSRLIAGLSLYVLLTVLW